MKQHKIIFIGDSAVGKTSIINQYIYESITAEHSPTIGIDFIAKTFVLDNQEIRFQIWDTAGQEKFHALIPNYVRSSTDAVVCYDITSRSSFENLDVWLKMIDDLANPSLIIVGNKSDLEEQRAVQYAEGQKFAEERHARFFETSATKGTNINDLFITIAKSEVPKQQEQVRNVDAPQPIDGNQLEQTQNTNAGKSSCC